jgi:hypothetical protein
MRRVPKRPPGANVPTPPAPPQTCTVCGKAGTACHPNVVLFLPGYVPPPQRRVSCLVDRSDFERIEALTFQTGPQTGRTSRRQVVWMALMAGLPRIERSLRRMHEDRRAYDAAMAKKGGR